MKIGTAPTAKPQKGIGMEGMLATWYAKTTASSLAEFRDLAKRISLQLPSGGVVLEVAPGPGYLAIELARLGPYRITGLDISRSFVRIATENATRAGLDVEFVRGDVAAMPFSADRFDFIVCRAAFKNFGDPVGALREMHRVLRPGGSALIIDMRSDASNDAIAAEVAKMHLGLATTIYTTAALRWLRKRAYSKDEFATMVGVTPLRRLEIVEDAIGFEIRVTK